MLKFIQHCFGIKFKIFIHSVILLNDIVLISEQFSLIIFDAIIFLKQLQLIDLTKTLEFQKKKQKQKHLN